MQVVSRNFSSSAPQIGRGTVLQGLGQVLGLDFFAFIQVGNGAGHPADAVIAAGGEAHALKGAPHDLLAGVVQSTALLQLGLGQVGVAGAAAVLDGAGLVHPRLDGGGGFSRSAAGELVKLHSGHLYKQVDAVQQRTGEPGEVALDLRLGAAAAAGGMTVPSALTGVHGTYQHELAGVDHRAGGPGNLNLPVLQGLTQHLQHILLKFRQLIQKQHPRLTVVFNTGTQMGVKEV